MEDLKSRSADFSKELRETYLGAFPHTVFTALVWIGSGIWGQFVSKPEAVLIFIVAGTFIFPGGELIRKIMKTPDVLSRENKLPQLFMLMAFTIPLSYPLIYLISKNNINLFFSSFTILVGAHYLPFIYGYRMFTFGIVSVLMVALGTFFSLKYPSEFTLPAFVTGAILLILAFTNYYLIKKQKI
jgi:hypothetical protein